VSEADFGETFGLSVNFLRSIGIESGPIHNKVFVGNVSLFFPDFFSYYI
jgi:hypothetical protein